MLSDSVKTRGLIAGTLLLLCLFAILSFNKNGEIVKTMKGEVQKCVLLSGSKEVSIPHATIKSENGSYVIASLKGCSPGAPVTILIKRGALYFNTVFAAEIN